MRITSIVLLVVLAAGCSEPVSLSPEHWPDAVREAYLAQMESGADLSAALEAVGHSLETTGKTGDKKNKPRFPAGFQVPVSEKRSLS